MINSAQLTHHYPPGLRVQHLTSPVKACRRPTHRAIHAVVDVDGFIAPVFVVSQADSKALRSDFPTTGLWSLNRANQYVTMIQDHNTFADIIQLLKVLGCWRTGTAVRLHTDSHGVIIDVEPLT